MLKSLVCNLIRVRGQKCIYVLNYFIYADTKQHKDLNKKP